MKTKNEICANCGHEKNIHGSYGCNFITNPDPFHKFCKCKKFKPQITEPDTGKLKTLKDINEYSRVTAEAEFDRWVKVEDLKQEAIKWVKHLDLEKEQWNYCLHHVEWIKHFFNITEEDLK
jgi:hypothetical protein